MDPYAILKCRSQEQRSSIAAGGHLHLLYLSRHFLVLSLPAVPIHFPNILLFHVGRYTLISNLWRNAVEKLCDMNSEQDHMRPRECLYNTRM
jgi:hypothetical protein